MTATGELSATNLCDVGVIMILSNVITVYITKNTEFTYTKCIVFKLLHMQCRYIYKVTIHRILLNYLAYSTCIKITMALLLLLFEEL